MTAKEWAPRLGLNLSVEQFRAAAYLERIGRRFLVDFGYENAVSTARSHWSQRRRELRERRKAKRY